MTLSASLRRLRAPIALMAFAALSGCAATDRWFGGGDAPRAAPLAEGRVHTVAKGDTVYGLSRRYSVSVDAIKTANQLDRTGAIHVGQRLRIPGPAAPARGAATQRAVAAAAPRSSAQAAAALGPRRLVRPAPGEIVRKWGDGVGARRNAGVDIGAAVGTPVVAAAEGTVAFVSDPTSPVGAVVLMQHSGGMTTIYGRLTDIAVKVGQKMRAGEMLARVAPRHGDRPALHFEIRHGSDPVNPTPYL